MTRIMTPERLRPYIEKRVSSRGFDTSTLTPEQLREGVLVPPGEIARFDQHDGKLPKSMIEYLTDRHIYPERMIQFNPREPFYFVERTGTAYFPVYSVITRANKYVRMMKAYHHVSERKFRHRVMDIDGDKRKTLEAYRTLADEFIRHLKASVYLDTIDDILFGPIGEVAEALGPDAKIEDLSTEYLGAQLFKIGRDVLHIGPVYSSQAQMLLDSLLLDYAGRAANRHKKREISIYMLGTAGGLLDSMNIEEFLCPTGFVDQVDLKERRKMPGRIVYPIHNVLARDGQGERNILNVTSVIDETYEELLLARDTKELSCCAVEMELKKFVFAINMARDIYMDLLKINSGFGVVVSDKPLHGITLADEPPIREGMLKGAGRILNYIKSRA